MKVIMEIRALTQKKKNKYQKIKKEENSVMNMTLIIIQEMI